MNTDWRAGVRVFETFDNQAERPSALLGVVSYFAQLCLAVPIGWIVASAFSLLGFGKHSNQVHFAGYDVLASLLAGALAGRVVGRSEPKIRRVGRWVWALPGAFAFPAILSQLLGPGPVPWLPDSLFISGGNEGLTVFLFTIPAFSALGYSVGMAYSDIRLSSGIVMGAALAFAVLAMGAHEVERSRIDARSRTRFVADPQGLRFSRDPMTLCSSGEALLLPSGTHVEALEHRSCGPGRLLDPGEPKRSREWDVERVRILDGPNKGMEGWVLAYGILGY